MVKYLIENHLSLIVYHLYLFGQLFRLPFPLFLPSLFPLQKMSSTQVGLRSIRSSKSRFKLYLVLFI
mgnify:CR=1 FL=1